MTSIISPVKGFFKVTTEGQCLTLPCQWQLFLSADIHCKQFGPRLGLTKHQAFFGSKLFDTLMVFLKDSFEKVNLRKRKSR